MKYIIIKVDAPGLVKEFPFIFDSDITHKVFAQWVERAVQREFNTTETKVVSAGFINHYTGLANGDSESLGLKCRPEDQAIIDRYTPRAKKD